VSAPDPTTGARDRGAMLELVHRLAAVLALEDELPDESTPIGRLTRDFLANNWAQARDGLLARTTKIRVAPQPSPAPRIFQFELDRPYLRRVRPDAPVERAEGPLRGTIRYRPDLYPVRPKQHSQVVFLDPAQHLLHPNYSPRFGVLCVGELPAGPYPLEDLLEHTYAILCYQNVATDDPADRDAADYFALHPDASSGLEAAEPLY